jgi:RNA polymerase sigma-70 factor, ECF subfamily
MDDKKLVKKALKGDKEAREQIFLLHVDMVNSIAYKFSGGNQAQAEDLVQKTFLRVFESLEKIKEPYRLKQWIGQVSYRQGLDHVRGVKTERTFENKYNVFDVLCQNRQFTPEEEMVCEQSLKIVKDTVDQMPDDDAKKTVNLFYKLGLSYQEIADKQNITPEAARQRMSRFRGVLKKRLLERSLEEKQ